MLGAQGQPAKFVLFFVLQPSPQGHGLPVGLLRPVKTPQRAVEVTQVVIGLGQVDGTPPRLQGLRRGEFFQRLNRLLQKLLCLQKVGAQVGQRLAFYDVQTNPMQRAGGLEEVGAILAHLPGQFCRFRIPGAVEPLHPLQGHGHRHLLAAEAVERFAFFPFLQEKEHLAAQEVVQAFFAGPERLLGVQLPGLEAVRRVSPQAVVDLLGHPVVEAVGGCGQFMGKIGGPDLGPPDIPLGRPSPPGRPEFPDLFPQAQNALLVFFQDGFVDLLLAAGTAGEEMPVQQFVHLIVQEEALILRPDLDKGETLHLLQETLGFLLFYPGDAGQKVGVQPPAGPGQGLDDHVGLPAGLLPEAHQVPLDLLPRGLYLLFRASLYLIQRLHHPRVQPVEVAEIVHQEGQEDGPAPGIVPGDLPNPGGNALDPGGKALQPSGPFPLPFLAGLFRLPARRPAHGVKVGRGLLNVKGSEFPRNKTGHGPLQVLFQEGRGPAGQEDDGVLESGEETFQEPGEHLDRLRRPPQASLHRVLPVHQALGRIQGQDEPVLLGQPVQVVEKNL